MGEKPLNYVGKTEEENQIFYNLLDKKPLNLERKIREENCMEDKIPRLKISQLK